VFESEREAEQAHVDRVYAQLRHAAASARAVADESRARYTSDRESWLREEVGTALFERDAFAFQAARRLAALDAEHEGLVFGRLDFTDREVRHIGRIGVRTDDLEPLVIDWRAPAAEPFYRATGADPMNVVRRRVLTCRDETVVGIDDDVLDPDHLPADLAVVGEGALMAALGRARSHQMHDIVATIQAEQDEVIRAPYPGFTILAGGPGTGKTVVGLHRVAYLLYTHRRRLENGGVLVVGPSAVFMDYIERVLPSLGEDSVTLHSLGDLTRDIMPVAASRTDPAEAAVLKGGAIMADWLRRLVALPLEPTADLRMTVKGEPFSLPAERLERIRHDALRDLPYHQARAAAERAIVDALWSRVPDDLEIDDAERFGDLVTSSIVYTDYLDVWWPTLTAEEVLARLADPQVCRAVVGPAVDADLLAASITAGSWSVADIALLDEIAALLGPAPRREEEDLAPLFIDDPSVGEVVTISDRLTETRSLEDDVVHSTYAHILVDEAQDVSPMQWRMLHRRGPQASWTIVGDPAQSSWPDPDETSRTLDGLIGSAPHRSYRLSTNYRSPAEVFDLARRVVERVEPEADFPSAVRRTGQTPRLTVASAEELSETVAAETTALLGEVAGTIGIITPDRHRSAIATGLDGLTAAEASRLVVIDPLTVKGLEYDAVIVVDPDLIVAESSGRERTLYVSLTRPTHRLTTIDVDAPGRWRPREDPAHD
jgi:DNA helicase IV